MLREMKKNIVLLIEAPRKIVMKISFKYAYNIPYITSKITLTLINNCYPISPTKHISEESLKDPTVRY